LAKRPPFEDKLSRKKGDSSPSERESSAKKGGFSASEGEKFSL
jgi:hypothetical protein